jgi:uncharacterized ion transporter superfamily protein YfcC
MLHPAGIGDITNGMVTGTIEAVDIIVFILVLGGLIGIDPDVNSEIFIATPYLSRVAWVAVCFVVAPLGSTMTNWLEPAA